MRQKVYSLIIIVIALTAMCLYVAIFNSSIRFENNKAMFYSDNFKNSPNRSLLLELPDGDGYLFHLFVRNQMEVELYLRSRLLDGVYTNVNQLELRSLYQSMLQYRPTWPYYHMGVAQIGQLFGSIDEVSLNSVIKFGPHEKKLVKSVSEILFYNWSNIESKTKIMLLNYLMSQTNYIIGLTVRISAKFARVYDYCDFIYEKKHVEYAACKQEYWQPLIKL